MKNTITLEESFNEKHEVSHLILEGETVRSAGILRTTREFSLGLNPEDLSFAFADAIMFGSTVSFRNQREFDDEFPGVFDGVATAKANGLLFVRRYEWDPNEGRNKPRLIPFGDYSAKRQTI